ADLCRRSKWREGPAADIREGVEALDGAGQLTDIRMHQRRFFRPDCCTLRTNRGVQLDASRQPAPTLRLQHFAPDFHSSRQNEKFHPSRVCDLGGFAWLPLLKTHCFMTIVEQNCCPDRAGARLNLLSLTWPTRDQHPVSVTELPQPDENGAAILRGRHMR